MIVCIMTATGTHSAAITHCLSLAFLNHTVRIFLASRTPWYVATTVDRLRAALPTCKFFSCVSKVPNVPDSPKPDTLTPVMLLYIGSHATPGHDAEGEHGMVVVLQAARRLPGSDMLAFQDRRVSASAFSGKQVGALGSIQHPLVPSPALVEQS